MGQEIECTMRYQRRSLVGKAYLETDYVLFRGEERLKLAFKDLTKVTAGSGVLKLQFKGGPAELELGAAAEKWANKILNPPSRADKLGIKPGIAVLLVGTFAPELSVELQEREAKFVKSGADLVFYEAAKAADLAKATALVAKMKTDGGLWIIYPKGVTAIREIDVLTAGRAAGLKDVKVASFSGTHTALKFVIPVSQR